MSHFSFVTSPITLIPRPGPGNGCLNISLSSIPNSKPIFLTSSLNNSFSGSTIWKYERQKHRYTVEIEKRKYGNYEVGNKILTKN